MIPSTRLFWALATPADAAVPPVVEVIRPWWDELREPTRLALAADGDVYVTDPRAGIVVVRAPDGSERARVTLGGEPLAIGVAPDGQVWVADAASGAVRRYDADWVETAHLGVGAGEVARPNDLVVHGGTGRIYVTDGDADLVRVYDASGAALLTFDGGTPIESHLDFPTGVAVDGDTVWAASQIGRRIVKFDLDGNVLSSFGVHGEEEGELFAPQGLWIEDGRVWVVDGRLGRVTAFDTAGTYLASVGAVGKRTGELSIPGDVVLDGWGRLVVASANNARLELFGVDTYTDPDLYVLGTVTLDPDALVRDELPGEVAAVIEIEGHPIETLDLGSVTANGLVPLSTPTVGDADADGRPDARAAFDRLALLGTLPADGTQIVAVAGTADGLSLYEAVPIEVIGPDGPVEGDADTDADADSDTDTDADSDTDTDADSDTDTDADSDADGDADGDVDADADGDADPRGPTTGDTSGTGDTGDEGRVRELSRDDGPAGCGSGVGAVVLLPFALLGRRRRTIAGAVLVIAAVGWPMRADATDPPHNFEANEVNCLDCHSPHGAPGGKLNIAETNPNVCMSCHTSSGIASEKPFLDADQSFPGISGTSHRFDSGPQGHVEAAAGNTSTGSVAAGGAFTGRVERVFTLTITTAGNLGTARFDWSDDDGNAGTNVTVATAVALADGVTANFANGSGATSFAAGDTFTLWVRTDLRLPDPADPVEEFLFNALDEGRVSCSTCHDQHSQLHTPADPTAPVYGGPGTGWGRHYQRQDNDANQMCVICHEVRDVPSSDEGSHPVGVEIPADPNFRAPPDLDLVTGDLVYCTTCHSPHFTSSGGANGGAGDGYLLDASIRDLCFECHLLADGEEGSHFVSPDFLWPGGQYGSTFPANTPERVNACVNCHWPHGWPDDANSAEDYPRLWVERYDADKVNPGVDPDDAEDLCFTCHDGNPASTDIRADFTSNWNANGTLFRTHPVRDSDQLGYPGTDRAVECVTCHNPHKARPDNRLAGMDGVDLAGIPVGEGTANPRDIDQWELCFKCHGDTYNVARDADDHPTSNKRLDFQPTNSAFHPVTAVGRNQSANLADQLRPNGLDTQSRILCTDCHASNRTLDATLAEDSDFPTGPHGSSHDWILRGNYSRNYTGESWSDNNAELCFNCHAESELLSENGSSNFYNSDRDNLHWYHLEDKDATSSCASCHFNIHSNRTASNTIYQIVDAGGTTQYTTPPTTVKTHLINFAPDVSHPDGGSPLWEITIDRNSSNFLRRRCFVACHGEEMDPESYEPPSGDDPNPRLVGCEDADGDGAPADPWCGVAADCDDRDPAIGPDGAEVCGGGADDDCDGATDCDDESCFGVDGCPVLVDADGDGYYEGASAGFADCDDGAVEANPDAREDDELSCGDGLDNDCDGLSDCYDAGCDRTGPCCTDGDGDGAYLETECRGAVDCDDHDPSAFPRGHEVDDLACSDGVDQDCDGRIDCLDPSCAGASVCCTDADGDGAFAEPGCSGVHDCDDADPAVAPGAPEDCADLRDTDCDTLADVDDPDCAGLARLGECEQP